MTVIIFVSVINENQTQLLLQNRKKLIPKHVKPLLS
jgi:hypothetical protein